MRKIIYSPDYGAGWTSWEDRVEVQKFMVDYLPIVEYLESGQDFRSVRFDRISHEGPGGGPSDEEMERLKFPDCLKSFVLECRERFEYVPYLAGLRDAEIKAVYGPVRITDYDGNETVEEGGREWI